MMMTIFDIRALVWHAVRPVLSWLLVFLAGVVLGAFLFGCNAAGVGLPIDAGAGDLEPPLPDCPRPTTCTNGSAGIRPCSGDAGVAMIDGLVCAYSPSVAARCVPRTPDAVCKDDVGYIGAAEFVPSCAACL